MSAVPTPTEEAVAAELQRHEDVSYDLGTPRAYTANGGWNRSCGCGEHLCSHEDECGCHRTHVARVLLDPAGPVAALVREERADALREAALALWSLEGPDLIAGANDAYGDWLDDRADREEQADGRE